MLMGMSHVETAAALGVPVGAVKTGLVAWPTKAVASSAAATALMNRLVRPLASAMVAERADRSARCSVVSDSQQLKQVASWARSRAAGDLDTAAKRRERRALRPLLARKLLMD